MKVLLVFCSVALVGCIGCDPPPPCSNQTCEADPTGPEGWQSLATSVWQCYGNYGNAGAPPLDKFHWIARGDCSEGGIEGIASSIGCLRGSTGIDWGFGAPSIRFIYVIDGGISDGAMAHELLHAWIALTRRQDDGDPPHHRPEWGSLFSVCKGG